MANQATITGKVKWFGLLNEPRPNKFKGNQLEWSFNIAVESKDKLMLRQNKVKKTVKFDEELGDYITVDYPVQDKKGNVNPTIKIVDSDNNEWDKTKWVGNDSVVEATFNLVKYGPFKTPDGQTVEGTRLVPAKIRVVEHKPYVKGGGGDSNTNKTAKVQENWTAEED